MKPLVLGQTRTFVTIDGTPCAIRRVNNGYVVFHGGWRVGTFKTEKGALRRIARLTGES